MDLERTSVVTSFRLCAWRRRSNRRRGHAGFEERGWIHGRSPETRGSPEPIGVSIFGPFFSPAYPHRLRATEVFTRQPWRAVACSRPADCERRDQRRRQNAVEASQAQPVEHRKPHLRSRNCRRRADASVLPRCRTGGREWPRGCERRTFV